MADLHFTNLLIVTAVAFAAPFTLGLVPALRLPAVVLELIVGIVLGPSVLGWVHVDEPVAVLALIGLGYLLFLAGLEVEFDKLRGALLRTAVARSAARSSSRSSCRRRRSASSCRCSRTPA
jgi:Kef-type K+ transport system membrane component KefB